MDPNSPTVGRFLGNYDPERKTNDSSVIGVWDPPIVLTPTTALAVPQGLPFASHVPAKTTALVNSGNSIDPSGLYATEALTMTSRSISPPSNKNENLYNAGVSQYEALDQNMWPMPQFSSGLGALPADSFPEVSEGYSTNENVPNDPVVNSEHHGSGSFGTNADHPAQAS